MNSLGLNSEYFAESWKQSVEVVIGVVVSGTRIKVVMERAIMYTMDNTAIKVVHLLRLSKLNLVSRQQQDEAISSHCANKIAEDFIVL
jgi:hypothetical protein